MSTHALTDSYLDSSLPEAKTQGQSLAIGDGKIQEGTYTALEEAETTLSEPRPKVEIGKNDIMVRAAGGKSSKKSAINAQGDRFDTETKEHLCKVKSILRVVVGLLVKLDGILRRLEFEHSRTDKEVVVKRQVVGYTWESVFLLVAALLLIGVGTNTIATILIASKIKVFANPLRAYLWSFVPAGFSLALVGIYNVLAELRRAAYVRLVWIGGVICGLIWVVLMSRVCSGFLQTTEAIIKAVVFAGTKSADADSGVNSPLLIACGILAEVLLSAGCSIGSRRACSIVEKGVTEKNKTYFAQSEQIAQLNKSRVDLEIVKGKLEARLEQFAVARKDFLNQAASWFDLSLSGHKPPSLLAKIASLLLIAFCFLPLPNEQAVAGENRWHLVLGVSPEATPEESTDVTLALAGMLASNAWDGRVTVVDPVRCRAVATMDITNDDLSAGQRIENNAEFFSNLHAYLSQNPAETNGSVHLPQFTEFVGRQLRRNNEPLVIFVIGSERYQSQEPGYAMTSNHVPSQDHIFASERSSVYGTLEKSNLLSDTRVHLVYRQDDFLSKFHSDAVADFWNVFLTKQGATLISDSSDFNTVWGRVLNNVSAPYKQVKTNTIGRICMLAVIGDRLIPIEETSPEKPAEDIAELQNRLQRAEKAAANTAEIKAQFDAASSRIASLTDAASQANAERDKFAQQVLTEQQRGLRAKAKASYDSLISAGDSMEQLQARIPLYEQAVAIANSNQLNPAMALARLEAIRTRLAPVRLPSDVKAELTHISTENYPPCLMVDLALLDSAQQPVLGLEDKDFVAVVEGRRATVRAAYVPKSATSQVPLSLLVALDCSGSMERVLPQAKAGVQGMLLQFKDRPNFQVKIISFAANVKLCCDWTSDVDAACRAVAGLRASGSTALYQAVSQGIASLSEQPGDRRLIVFTDGGDTKGGTFTSQALGEQIKANGILPYFIGLKTRDLDTNCLNTMASASGGYFDMSGAEDLSGVFSEAGKRLARQTYRLIVLPDDRLSTRSPLLGLMIGGGPTMVSVKTNIALPTVNGATARNN